jgi:hypothetical protein
MHGGRAPAAGPTHPGFKHGRYSRVLDGKDIAEKYEMLRDDPKLLELSEEIAVLVALQQETLTKLGTGGTGFHTWQHVRHLAKEAKEGPKEARVAKLDALMAIADGALGDADVWAEYTERAEVIRKLVDTERKYREGLGLYLPLERADAIMQTWLDVLRRVLPRDMIAAVYDEFRKVRQTPPSMGRDVTTIARRG